MPKLTTLHYILIAVGLFLAYRWYMGRKAKAATPDTASSAGGGGGFGGGGFGSSAATTSLDDFLNPSVDATTGRDISVVPQPTPTRVDTEIGVEPIAMSLQPKGTSVAGTTTAGSYTSSGTSTVNPFVDSNSGK